MFCFLLLLLLLGVEPDLYSLFFFCLYFMSRFLFKLYLAHLNIHMYCFSLPLTRWVYWEASEAGVVILTLLACLLAGKCVSVAMF